MLLGEILHRSVIQPSLQATEKFAAIDELIDVLIDAGDLPKTSRETVREAVVSRELSMGTGMEMGLAIPHGASEKVPKLIGALGISRDGIDFECLDGQPAKLILLLILPRSEFHIHVQTLAGISQLLSEASFRDALMEAEDADAVLDLIRGGERSSIFDAFRRRFT